MDGFRKQLTIKRKVVERNTKDVTSYREEYEEDARIVKKMEVVRVTDPPYAFCKNRPISLLILEGAALRSLSLRAWKLVAEAVCIEANCTVSSAQEERREPSDIKQRRNVMNETLMMVYDSESRLSAACKDLCDFISSRLDLCRPALYQLSSCSEQTSEALPQASASWLVEELAAARDALLRASEVNPAHPFSMDLFQVREHEDKTNGECEESLDDI